MRRLQTVPFSKMLPPLDDNDGKSTVAGFYSAVDKRDAQAHHFKGNRIKNMPIGSMPINLTPQQAGRKRAAARNCALCEKPLDGLKCLDHDHKTGEFRGVLCVSCNTALGYLEKFYKNPALIDRFSQYLGRKIVVDMIA